MKPYFFVVECPHCQNSIDSISTRCPHCGKNIDPQPENEGRGRDFLRFENQVQIEWKRQLGLALAGSIGLLLISLVIQFIFVGAGYASGTLTKDNLEEWASTYNVDFWVNLISYVSLAGALGLILWKGGWKEIFRSFKVPKAYLWAFAVFGGIYVASVVWAWIKQGIITAAGITGDMNQNETSVQSMIKAAPVVSFFLFGVIAPFCEEVCYRVGLYSLVSRVQRWLAIVTTTLVFGFIHFRTSTNPNALLLEFLNLPSYLIAGLGFAIAYEKGGFAASFTIHSLSNLMNVIDAVVNMK